MVDLRDQTMNDILAAQRQLAIFDINEEYEELLGTLRDGIIQRRFEEFAWRTGADIQPRQVMLSNMSSESPRVCRRPST